MNETEQLFNRLRLLDKSEEPSDVREWDRIRERLVELYAPLVVKAATDMLDSLGLNEANDLHDLISVGFEALTKAMNDFDPAQEVEFGYFAKTRIHNAMKHYRRDSTDIIREPGHVQDRRSSGLLIGEPVRAIAVGLAGQDSDTGAPNGLDATEWVKFDVSELAAARAVLVAFLDYLQRLADYCENERSRQALLKERGVVYLHFRSQAQIEIARRLDISESNVSYHLKRGLKRLKDFTTSEN